MDSRGRLALTLRADGHNLTASVREVGRAEPAQSFDAGVTMHGVLVANHDAYGRTGPSRLLVSSTREITITRPALTPSEIRLLTVQALVNGGSSPSARRVRMRGAVSAAGDGFRLTDATGAVALDPAGKTALAVGDDVEVAGFPAEHDGRVTLEQAMQLEDEIGGAAHASRVDAGGRYPRHVRRRGQARLPGQAARDHHLLQPVQHQPGRAGRQAPASTSASATRGPEARERPADRPRWLHQPRRCRAGNHGAAHQGDRPGAAASAGARIDPVAILRRRRRLPVDRGRRYRRRHRASRRPHLHRPPPALQADRDGHSRRAGAAAGPAPRACHGAGCGRLALQLPPPDARHHAAAAERGLPARRRGGEAAAGDDNRRTAAVHALDPRRRAIGGAGRRTAGQPDRPDVAQRRHGRRARGDARARRVRDRRRGPRDRLRRTRRLQPRAAFGGADQGGFAAAAAGGTDDARRHLRGWVGTPSWPRSRAS